MNWYQNTLNWFSPNKAPDIVPMSGRRKQGQLVDEAERLKLVATYEKRITQCNQQIKKWEFRKSSGYEHKSLADIRHTIAAIKSSKKEFESLIQQNQGGL